MNERKVVAHDQFWKIYISEPQIDEFIDGYYDLINSGIAEGTPIHVGPHVLYYSRITDELMLVFATDGKDEERVIKFKVREGASRIATALKGNQFQYVKDNLSDILGELIITRFKFSFVGLGGVGKSTLLRLLFGKEPAPGGYVPTINVAVDATETIRFGTYDCVIWDFGGQEIFHDLWQFYFQGTDIIFLVSDSSFRNVMQTKTLLRNIRRQAPAVPIYIIANKQDLPESMKPESIQRLLGVPTFPMVATDKSRREEFIRLMLEVATKSAGVTLPDRPISDLIVVRRKTELDVEKAEPEKKVQTMEEFWEDADKTVAENDEVIETEMETEAEVEEPVKALEAKKEKPVEIPAGAPKIYRIIIFHKETGELILSLDYDFSVDIENTTLIGMVLAAEHFSRDMHTESKEPVKAIKRKDDVVLVGIGEYIAMAILAAKGIDESSLNTKIIELVKEFEDIYQYDLNPWDGNTSKFGMFAINIVEQFPMKHISMNQIPRRRAAGRPLPISDPIFGRRIVEVQMGIDGKKKVGDLVKELSITKEELLAILEILYNYNWIDLKSVIDENTKLMKLKDPDPELVEFYGEIILKFVNLCDGNKPLKQIVNMIGMSHSAMSFVAQKLVVEGVLEIV